MINSRKDPLDEIFLRWSPRILGEPHHENGNTAMLDVPPACLLEAHQ